MEVKLNQKSIKTEIDLESINNTNEEELFV